jgi:hypothetical protein
LQIALRTSLLGPLLAGRTEQRKVYVMRRKNRVSTAN